MRRGDVTWADLGEPAGRRPVCVVTRDAAIDVLAAVTCAPITRTVRGIASEVSVGVAEGLPTASVINCDNLMTVPVGRLDEPVGALSLGAIAELDAALRYALGIRF